MEPRDERERSDGSEHPADRVSKVASFVSKIAGRRRMCAVLATIGTAVLVLAFALAGNPRARAQGVDPGVDEGRIQQGLAIAPVPLDLEGKNRALVGLGSYIVNAVVGCSDCHTWPQFAPGGNPFLGQPERTNTAGYLGGGRTFVTPFGNFVSDNITPDPVTGLPAGLTFDEFELIMRTGLDHDEGDLLQVMPWPWYRKMTERDLRAIYEYLCAVPSVP